MSHESISSDHELKDVEAILGALAPARCRIDRDRVMFRAGQASMGTRTSGQRVWMSIAAALGALALGEAVLLTDRSPPKVVERIVVVREPAAKPAPPASTTPERIVAQPSVTISRPMTLGRTAQERLAGLVLRYGLDGLPASPSAAWVDAEPRSAPSRQLLQEELWKELDLGDPS